jgi:hypothetical protein
LLGGGPVATVTANVTGAVAAAPVVRTYAGATAPFANPAITFAYIHTVEAIAADEVVIDNDVVPAPAGIPSPSAPATAPEAAYRHSHTE